MLGKQWLNRYDSTDMRGTAIERAQSRQLKLDGIITWYFHYVMESLSLMLQGALLLLGCALSRYLWEVNIPVASVVLGITSFGVSLYLLIVIAGAAFESCPYQTPGASISRPIIHYVRYHLHPAVISSRLPDVTLTCIVVLKLWPGFRTPWCSTHNIITLSWLLFIPFSLAFDSFLLGQAILRWLARFCRCVYRWQQDTFDKVRWLLVSFGKSAYHWFTHVPQAHDLDQRTITFDLQCISWILQTSLDKLVHLVALKHLAATPELAEFNPTLVAGCFNVFINCISVDGLLGIVVIKRRFEELAIVSATGFFRTFFRLSAMDPTSSILVDIRRHYDKVFPDGVDLRGLPFCFTMNKIHILLSKVPVSCPPQQDDGILPALEYIQLSKGIVNTTRAATQRMRHVKVPVRFLHFVAYSLSADPPPPVPVIADCLKIVAIDLGCDLSNITAFEYRYTCPDLIIVYISD